MKLRNQTRAHFRYTHDDGRTRRKPRNTAEQRTSRFVDPMVMISERPPRN